MTDVDNLFASDELNTLIAQRVMGLEVEMRRCNYDIKNDEWYEVQANNEVMEKALELNGKFGSDKDRPCFKFEGWDDMINDTTTVWHVLPDYSHEITAAAEILDRLLIKKVTLKFKRDIGLWYATLRIENVQSSAFGYSKAEALCRAALKIQEAKND